MQGRTTGCVSAFNIMKLNVFPTLLVAILVCLAACSSEPAVLRDVKLALKNKKPAEALKLVDKYRHDSLYAGNVQLFAYAIQAGKKLYDIENEKIYLQQKPDTAALFRILYSIFDYALLTDSLETADTTTVSSRHSQRAHHRALLERLYPNIATASRYYLTKEQWSDATRFAKISLEAARTPLLTKPLSRLKPEVLPPNAANYLFACFADGRYSEAEHYKVQALQDTARLTTVLRILALNSEADHREKDYLDYLQQGVLKFPNDDFFFSKLSSAYFRRGEAQQVLGLANHLLPLRKDSLLLYEAQARAYSTLGKDSLCIQTAREILRIDSTQIIADYYLGKSYVGLAHTIILPTSIKAPGYVTAFKKQRRYYAQARIYIERFRKSSPKAAALWAPLLYEIYLNLNLGKEFEEISPYLPS